MFFSLHTGEAVARCADTLVPFDTGTQVSCFSPPIAHAKLWLVPDSGDIYFTLLDSRADRYILDVDTTKVLEARTLAFEGYRMRCHQSGVAAFTGSDGSSELLYSVEHTYAAVVRLPSGRFIDCEAHANCFWLFMKTTTDDDDEADPGAFYAAVLPEAQPCVALPQVPQSVPCVALGPCWRLPGQSESCQLVPALGSNAHAPMLAWNGRLYEFK